MIVGTLYHGDDDNEIAWKQHDVYGTALGQIVRICNRLTRFAMVLLDVEEPSSWGTTWEFDHRTLQWAHDLLAAAWRSKHDTRQLELPFKRTSEHLLPHTPEGLWLRWLREEVESWVWEPGLVRCVITILANQNQPEGYIAESKLSLALLDRFSDVPWVSSNRDAFETDLANDLAKLNDLPTQKTTEIESSAGTHCD